MKALKRLLLASAISVGCVQGAMAIGAYPRPILMQQPDGTTLLVRIHGDENYHYVTSSDGFLLQKDKQGYFCYVDYDMKTGKRIPTLQRAHNAAERSDSEKQVIANLTAAQTMNADFLKRNKIVRKAPAKTLSPDIIAPRRAAGKKAEVKESQYLVILVNFTDSVMRHTKTDFDRWLNEPGYNVNGGTGSVKDYYRDNSMGQYIPNFQVVGPYTLSKPTSYYGGNYGDSGTDTNPRDMVREALELARKDNPTLDFTQFDNDGDGEMDNCYIIYAGYSEASTANTDDIWPHSWNMGDDQPVYDGIRVNNYSCSAELVGMPGNPAKPSMDGIGTFTHEFGHVLGLKDMYDTDSYTNGNALDPGAYSLYASGSYNNNSNTPPCLMAFERMQLGWMKEGEDIVELKNPEDVTLDNISANKARFINAQPERAEGTGMEWFILENRQQTGWDKYIPAHGLLITHYDYTKEMQDEWWSVNGPNNQAQHRCMYIVPADGIDDSNSRSGDTYPGSSANTEFTDTSTPAAINWNNEKLGVPVTNITEGEGIVRFQVSGGTSQWNTIKTLVPEDVRDVKATFKAEISNNANGDIKEIGFCWNMARYESEPSIGSGNGSSEAKVDDIANPTLTVSNLQPGVKYNVRSYMKLADGQTVYGSTVPFSTECQTANVDLDNPFTSDFTSWTDGQPDCWQIVDNNGDGTTWIADETSNSIVYSFNYWNDADDYLICKRRIHVPEHGTLFFTRGVSEQTAIENLEVLVSTKSSNIKDFNLHERLSFADYFYQQHMEEVDLSQYAGQDIYIAFRCCSDKMQGDLWLWDVMVTDKLQAPTITKFERNKDGGLHVEWTPVEGAAGAPGYNSPYYLYFGKETEEANQIAEFAPMSAYKDATGDVDLANGSIFFKSTGSVTLRDFAEGIDQCMFIVTTSGPLGTSTLTVEGTTDGKTWQIVGPKTTCKEYDSEGQEVNLTSYMQDKHYRTLRFNFQHGGRNARIKYLTLVYNDGKVYEDLAAGGVSNNYIDINPQTPGEFDEGKYKVWVASGWYGLYYDESAPAYYEATATAISDVIDGTGIKLAGGNGTIRVSGIKPGYEVTCTSTTGMQLFHGIAEGNSIAIPTNGRSGVVIMSISGEGKTVRTKTIIR